MIPCHLFHWRGNDAPRRLLSLPGEVREDALQIIYVKLLNLFVRVKGRPILLLHRLPSLTYPPEAPGARFRSIVCGTWVAAVSWFHNKSINTSAIRQLTVYHTSLAGSSTTHSISANSGFSQIMMLDQRRGCEVTNPDEIVQSISHYQSVICPYQSAPL